MKLHQAKSGYIQVGLHRKGSPPSTKNVHRLVLAAYVGLSDGHCNHINGIKQDNRLENLEYCSHSDNIKHAYDNGLLVARKGFGNPLSVVDSDILQDFFLRRRAGESYQAIADHYSVDYSTVYRWVNN